MALDDLKEVIEKLQGRITNHKNYLQKEPRTRILLVDPLLRELGWNVECPDLVELEYEPESSKRVSADYVLKNDKNNIAIVEVKSIGKTIENLGVLEQAEKYASSAGAPFIILTNGVKWLLYERSPTASLASLNPVVSFDIEHDEPYYCVSACVSMWSPNLSSGNSMKATTSVQASLRAQPNSGSDLTNEKEKEQTEESPWKPPKLAKELYLEYWKVLKSSFEGRNNGIKFRKPQPQCYMGFKVGRSGFRIHTWASKEEKYVCVGLTVEGTHGRSHFDRLKMSKTEIERKISPELEWQENPKQNYIRFYLRNTDLEDTEDWKRQHQWLCEQLETFHKVFVPRVEALNASN